MQYLPGETCQRVAEFMDCHHDEGDCFEDAEWIIDTREGMMIANPGDWIIKGVAGEFYPCKPAIFDATYDPVLLNPPPHDP